jgi:hypothetical protein
MKEDEDIWTASEIERQRDTWFNWHLKPGMNFEQVIRLNEETFRLFPRTERERKRKTASLITMPEFAF